MIKKYASLLKDFSTRVWITLLVIACSSQKEQSALKIFRYNQDTDITSLDPAFARNQGNIWAVSQLYNGLLSLNAGLQISPDIAQSYQISNGGRTYTFQLQKGVYFHDDPTFPEGKGREVRAQDFVYSFFRILDAKTASPGAWIFNDKVLRKADGTISDTCFKALSDYKLRIHLDKPFPPFLQLLTMPYAYVVPSELVEKWGKEFRNHPVGTGPFQLQVWEEKSALIFTKNTRYWKNDSAGTRLPYIDRVHISFVNDRNLAFMEFRQGKLDFISGLDENSRDVVFDGSGQIKKEFEDQFNVSVLPYMNTEYLGIQTDPNLYTNIQAPLLQKTFRQALNYAINKDQMVQYILNNLGTPGSEGFVPPFMMQTSLKYYPYNPEKARQLLDSCKYKPGVGGYTVKLSTISRFPYKEIAEFVQREWSKIGIDVSIETLDNPTLLENVAQGRIPFFRASWLGDYSDPENYLACFYSKNFTPGGPNKTHFSNSEFDALYEQSLLEQNTDKRYAMYTKMDQLIMEQAPVVVLWYDKVVRLTQKRVKGLEINAMNSLNLERVQLN